MTYDEQYSDIEELKQPFNVKFRRWEDVIKGTTKLPCWNCKTLTFFVSISFEAPMCSYACDKAKTREYWEAFRRRIF